MRDKLRHSTLHSLAQPFGGVDQPLVDLLPRARRRHHAASVAANHRDDAVEEVAQLIGQIPIVRADETLQTEVAILGRPNLAQQVIAQRVRPIALHECSGVEYVAD